MTPGATLPTLPLCGTFGATTISLPLLRWERRLAKGGEHADIWARSRARLRGHSWPSHRRPWPKAQWALAHCPRSRTRVQMVAFSQDPSGAVAKQQQLYEYLTSPSNRPGLVVVESELAVRNLHTVEPERVFDGWPSPRIQSHRQLGSFGAAWRASHISNCGADVGEVGACARASLRGSGLLGSFHPGEGSSR